MIYYFQKYCIVLHTMGSAACRNEGHCPLPPFSFGGQQCFWPPPNQKFFEKFIIIVI